MRKTLLLPFFAFLFSSTHILAQNDVLFSVGETKVKKSEFEYIYKKNNFNNKADFSRKSLQDYLDLYINFRLKVKEAIAQGLDTSDRFKEELGAYEKQLLDSYVDKEVSEKLIRQEYERSKTDINISHIFFSTGKDGSEADALEKANAAYQKIKAGASFEEVAKSSSEDKQTAVKGGKVGWLNSYQLSFPELEEVAYNLKVGEITEPVRTRSGYHILKLNETRPAKQKIKAAIIKRFFPITDASEAAKKATEDTILAAYAKLKKNVPFEEIVQQYSEDDVSKSNKGELDWFGINTYAKVFEDNAYALKDGEYSAPFSTSTAWYIVKKLQTAKPLTYEEAIPVLKAKLAASPQYQYELDKFTQKVIAASGIKEYKENYPAFKQRLIQLSQDGPFLYRDTADAKPLLQAGTKTYNENDFGRKIQEIFYTVYPQAGLDKYDVLIKNTVQTFVIEEYKKDIRQNNQEYKALMDEYRNGIMIFALSENNIWNKASEDSTGLLAYYNAHKTDFNLKKRATVRKITAATDKQAKAIYKYLSLHPKVSDDSLIAELKSIGLSSANLNVQVLDATKTKLNISVASLSLPKLTGNKYELTQVYNLQPPKTRVFEECRGYVVAAYQEYLEKQWLQQLRQKYPVVVDKAVFETLVHK